LATTLEARRHGRGAVGVVYGWCGSVCVFGYMGGTYVRRSRGAAGSVFGRCESVACLATW